MSKSVSVPGSHRDDYQMKTVRISVNGHWRIRAIAERFDNQLNNVRD